jgi:hypothetical protein
MLESLIHAGLLHCSVPPPPSLAHVSTPPPPPPAPCDPRLLLCVLLLLCVCVCVCVLLPAQGFLYVRSSKVDNEYAHPLDLCPLVDLNLGKVSDVCVWVC